jgi:DNA replication protein DnaC
MNLLSSVQEQLCRLSMKHASKELEGILENAQHHDWTPLQTLQALLAIELENRQDSGRLRRLKAANFPFHKTLEDFDFGFQNSVSKRQIQQLAEMAWLEGAYNIMFLGPPGGREDAPCGGLGDSSGKRRLPGIFYSDGPTGTVFKD